MLVLTHDVRLADGTISRLETAAAVAPTFGILAPELYHRPGEPFSFGGVVEPGGRVRHLKRRGVADTAGIGECDWADGAALLLNRRMLELIGLFEERFFMYCEDSDLALRGTQWGWRVGTVRDAVAFQAPGKRQRPGAYAYLMTRNGLDYRRRVGGVRGVVAGIYAQARVLMRLAQVTAWSGAAGGRPAVGEGRGVGPGVGRGRFPAGPLGAATARTSPGWATSAPEVERREAFVTPGCHYLRRGNSPPTRTPPVAGADCLMASTDLDLGRYKLGWSDEEDYVFKPKKGLNEDIVREMSWMKGEPDWMLDYPPQVAPGTSSAGRCPTGAATCRRSTSTTSTTTSSPPTGQVDAWDELPDVDQEHLREARHPRGRAQVPRRRHRPVRVRGRLPPQP